ncbi:MAG TPA: hypothetical protein VI485_06660 [Vicinamibacterales bacterium]|nr:hypothetical protein [Vicinamibacterales bacterium]
MSHTAYDVRYVAWLMTIGLAAALALALLGQVTGRISVNNGYGYDGEHYVRMIESGFKRGTPSMRLRPVVLLINDEVNYHFFHNALATFRAMNLVYAFWLAVILADLCLRYEATRAAAAVLVLNLSLCISVAKMFAFYPALVDLGAYAFMAASVLAIVSGRRLAIVATTIVAVLSREFAVVTVFFGIVRDLRQGRSLRVVAATYTPAVVAFFWIRRFARSYSVGPEVNEPVLSLGGLVTALMKNTEWWFDPAYAAFWLYFAATLFGGVSLLLLTTMTPLSRGLRREPEWLAMIVPIVAVTALGYIDTWRYGAFLLPVVPPLWAWSVSTVQPGRQRLLFIAVSAATIATQRPWQHMDLASYFRDWFPYYLVIENRGTALETLWPVWRAYIAVALVSLVVLGILRARAAAGAPRVLQPVVE